MERKDEKKSLESAKAKIRVISLEVVRFGRKRAKVFIINRFRRSANILISIVI